MYIVLFLLLNTFFIYFFIIMQYCTLYVYFLLSLRQHFLLFLYIFCYLKYLFYYMYLFIYFNVWICHSNIILCLRPQFVGLYQVKSKISVAQSSCLKYYTPYTPYTPHTILTIPLLLCALAWIYKLQNCLTMRLLMLELPHFYMATHTHTHACVLYVYL